MYLGGYLVLSGDWGRGSGHLVHYSLKLLISLLCKCMMCVEFFETNLICVNLDIELPLTSEEAGC